MRAFDFCWKTASACALCAAVTLVSTSALAQSAGSLSGTEVSLAETLYREGRQLMTEKRYAEACAKFAESNRLDIATGTMLNLAACYEVSGKLASAWSVFGEALRAARRESREERVQFAEQRLRAIEPRMARLTVMVEKGSIPQLLVKLDGVVIGPAAFGVAMPIDPGVHQVAASAPDHLAWSADVEVTGDGTRSVVTVPALEPTPKPIGVADAGGAEPAPKAVPAPPAPRRSRPIPGAAFVSGGAAVLFAGGAAVTGVVYLNRRAEYEDRTGDAATTKWQSARFAGWLNLGLSAAALASASVTAYLYLSRPEHVESMAFAPRVSPWFSSNAAGLELGSEF